MHKNLTKFNIYILYIIC